MEDYKIVYNPKRFNGKTNSAKVTDVFGRREGGTEQGRLIEKPAVYSVSPNELKKFRVDVADYLLGKYGFLQEVAPTDLDKVLREMKDKLYKCKLCEFETDSPLGLSGHMKSHKLSEEAQKILEEIPEAEPEAFVVGAEHSRSGRTEFHSIDAATGTSDGSDRDGVEWYGGGTEEVRERGGQRPVTKGGTPGMRPAVL